MSESDGSKTAAAGSYRELLIIAVPLMLSAGTQSLMHVIDRVFLTWHSETSLAAALPAGILYWTLLSLPFGVASYINTFVAQYEGAGKPERVAAAVWQGAYFAVGVGLLLMFAIPWAEVLFAKIGHEPAIAAEEAIYFRWLLAGSVPAVLHTCLSAFYSGRGKTMVVLAVNAGCVAVNAVMDYAFIFGWGPIPSMGIAGAAMTDVFGEILATAIFIGLLARPSIRVRYPFERTWRIDTGLFRDLLRYGGPSGLQMFIDVAGFAAFVMIIGWLGQDQLAATNTAFNLNTLAFIPVIGVGIAVSTLVGQRIGEGRPELAEISTWKGFVVAGSYMLVFGAIYVLLPDLLLAPYAARADAAEYQTTRDTVTVLLRFVAVYSFFDAMAIIFGSAVRGAGDTRFSMWLSFVSAWALLVLPTYFTWQSGYRSLWMCWLYCTIYVIFLGFAFLIRFQQGRWKGMNVIHRGESAAVNSKVEVPSLPVVA